MIACVIFVQRVLGGGELDLIEVSEVVRQPERPHKQRLDRVRRLALVVDGVLETMAVLPYYRLAPPDFFGRNASQDVERLERAVAVGPFRQPDGGARSRRPRGRVRVGAWFCSMASLSGDFRRRRAGYPRRVMAGTQLFFANFWSCSFTVSAQF